MTALRPKPIFSEISLALENEPPGASGPRLAASGRNGFFQGLLLPRHAYSGIAEESERLGIPFVPGSMLEMETADES